MMRPRSRPSGLGLGHAPIIEAHPRSVPGGKEAIAAEALARRTAGYALAEEVRYNERSAAERINLDFSNISVHRGRESEKDVVLQQFL